MKPAIPIKDILKATFRANPSYELVLFDRLSPEQQAVLADLRKDPDLYGVLRPIQPSGLGIKSVCCDTALLYLTLQRPGALPSYVQGSFGKECNKAIAELVLDSVLEIGKDDGSFVSGSDAYELLYDEKRSTTALGNLAQLSVEALKYAQALDIGDITRLSARMYFYNRQPASPKLLDRLPTVDAVAKCLGIHKNGSNQRTLSRHWLETPLSPPYNGWRMWERRDEELEPAQSAKITYKLYVSPALDFIQEAFGATVQVMTLVKAPKFKVGSDVYGLLRPDKIVAYFEQFETLQDASQRLQNKLAGCPVHGVPFTAELAGDGLMSWGMDPPRNQQALIWQERESWRLWVTNHLATALLSAKQAKSSTLEPWQFALERLQLEGVNTVSWVPEKTIWEN
jgi:hypothetical protein